MAPSADLELTLHGIAFAAMGTAGQRCTTLRRLFVHDTVYDALVARLRKVYSGVAIGDPRDAKTLVGPLIDRAAYEGMQRALQEARDAGGKVHGGERIVDLSTADAFYVRPALVEMPKHAGPVLRETFAPILYVMRYGDLREAIAEHNAVGAGLSSSIFTFDMREAELFISPEGSDCGKLLGRMPLSPRIIQDGLGDFVQRRDAPFSKIVDQTTRFGNGEEKRVASLGAGAAVTSPACPAVTTRRSGRPRASASMWILVVNPPRERPSA